MFESQRMESPKVNQKYKVQVKNKSTNFCGLQCSSQLPVLHESLTLPLHSELLQLHQKADAKKKQAQVATTASYIYIYIFIILPCNAMNKCSL